MRSVFFIIFSPFVFGSTLLETQTAVGISNTLQGTAQVNSQELINQAKGAVENYKPDQSPVIQNPSSEPQSIPNNEIFEQADLSNKEQTQIEGIGSPSPNFVDNNFSPPPNDDIIVVSDNEQNLNSENSENQDEFLDNEEDSINYKQLTHIFYKNPCKADQANCVRSGAVLTNIKSVIFDYDHNRGKFSESSDKLADK
ncbi:MAG: hypothetical protein OXC37_04805 [Bdellovibrionaceae bacterium]|nr:hypothetical protein [Pseudobdellovibrionaceae bacterium]